MEAGNILPAIAYIKECFIYVVLSMLMSIISLVVLSIVGLFCCWIMLDWFLFNTRCHQYVGNKKIVFSTFI